MTRESILATLRDRKPSWMAKYPISRMGLFGSWARGEQTDASDVDILVEVDPRIGLRFVSLAEEIERELGRPVDLVSRRAVKPSRLPEIESDLIDV